MHLPDHYLDPFTAATTALLSGGAVTYALVRLRSQPATNILPAAAVGAGIFAAQMINFPVASGTSGHLVGGALAGMLLGPWAGLLTMAVVLAVQAVVFGDGGILALGANILNMGVIGVGIGAIMDQSLRHFGCHWLGQCVGAGCHWLCQCFAAALAAWLSVMAAALGCAIEMSLSGPASATDVVPAMLSIHALIGFGEAAITAPVVFVAFAAPSRVRHAHAGLFLAAIIVVALAPFASSLPDGLESVAESLSVQPNDTTLIPSLFAEYALPGIPWPPAATVLAGLLGVALTYYLTTSITEKSRRIDLRE